MCIRDRNSSMEEQFKKVKELFINTVMSKFPITGRRFYLQCDGSNYAYGGQLYQIDDNGEVAVIAFTSKTFKNSEKNYFATQRELLAIVPVSYTHLDVYKRQVTNNLY